MGWFDVDRKGLAKLLEKRGKSLVVVELLQNSWDSEATQVDVELKPVEGKPRVYIKVTDDDPDGFKDLSHAFTLFAESEKKDDPTKRGRFNLGEKLVLSLCHWARIVSTTGAYEFNEKDGQDFRSKSKNKTPKGSYFEGELRMTREEYTEVLDKIDTLIPPPNVKTTVNGNELEIRECISSFKDRLPTEIADEEGNLKKTIRKTTISIYDTRNGEKACIYEMGIPVVETGDKFHIDVCIAPSTRILTADLRYVYAHSLKKGMELVGFDEHRNPYHRHFRKSIIKNIKEVDLPSYELTFDDGTTIICSQDHQWLCLRHGSAKGHGRTCNWLYTKNMVATKGKRKGSCVAKPLDVWDTNKSFRGGYLSAAFDGEGCFIQRKVKNPNGVSNNLIFTQKDNEMLSQVRNYLDQENFKYREYSRDKTIYNKNWKVCHTLELASRQDIIKFLGSIRPYRLLDKMDINLLGTLPTRKGVRLIKKEFIGMYRLLAITTTTKTFIAEGLASHNCQKVPLNFNRDNVTPSYLRTLRTMVFNQTHTLIDKEEANDSWVREATSDERCTTDAIKTAVTHRFGEKAVAFDPGDLEANKRAMSEGYTIIPGRSMNKGEWENIRQAQSTGVRLALPSGQVTPSPTPFSADGAPLKTLSEEKYTEGIKKFIKYAKWLAKKLIGNDIFVVIANDRGWGFTAAYGDERLTVNVTRVGYSWFDNISSLDMNALLLHEFAHKYSGDHLSSEYHQALCDLGAKLARIAAKNPSRFKKPGI